MSFSLIVKHDDVSWVLQHKQETVAVGPFNKIVKIMQGYGFSLEDVHEAVAIMSKHEYNFASFGFDKRFVVAKTIDDARVGTVYNA